MCGLLHNPPCTVCFIVILQCNNMSLTPPFRSVEDLAAALASLRSDAEAYTVLRDLCTPAEIRSLAERWQVARLLDEGKLTYRDIHDATGVSTTTIVRVARFLKEEQNGGYRLLLDRLKADQETKA